MSRGVVLDALQIGTSSVVMMMSLAFNVVLVGASLCKTKETTSEDYLMVAMAAADISVALTIPLHLLADFEMLGDVYSLPCMTANSFTVSMPLVALFTLIILTVERCINIFAPLRATELVTKRRVVVVLGTTWLYGFVLTITLPLGLNTAVLRQQHGSNETDCNFAAVAQGPWVAFLLLGNFFPGMFVLLVLNATIFGVAQKTLRKVTHEWMAYTHTDNRRQVFKHKARTNAVMFACQFYIFSYLPIAIALTVDFQFFMVEFIELWRAPFLLYILGYAMGNLSTVVNPIILIRSSRNYREWVLVKVFRRQHSNEERECQETGRRPRSLTLTSVTEQVGMLDARHELSSPQVNIVMDRRQHAWTSRR
ncbi:uncharacterized protein LOC112555159 [Pomacea canaliculata]|uniref:uncharacterized protein LOC112555159 n=1 Tax=Pomacea canaliculata TaxID=400727 RepID=UPI000D737F49|nr:uncharacterized protein LOC112555159 [Pomacea canaliculata]